MSGNGGLSLRKKDGTLFVFVYKIKFLLQE